MRWCHGQNVCLAMEKKHFFVYILIYNTPRTVCGVLLLLLLLYITMELASLDAHRNLPSEISKRKKITFAGILCILFSASGSFRWEWSSSLLTPKWTQRCSFSAVGPGPDLKYSPSFLRTRCNVCPETKRLFFSALLTPLISVEHHHWALPSNWIGSKPNFSRFQVSFRLKFFLIWISAFF